MRTIYFLLFIYRRCLVSFRKVGGYNSIISITTSVIIIPGTITVEQLIIGITKVKLMGTICDKIAKS